MPACEKCWSESQAGWDRWVGYEGQETPYQKVKREKEERGEVCTPEEQAGPDATECTKCKRRTRHQHCGDCMACGSPRSETPH